MKSVVFLLPLLLLLSSARAIEVNWQNYDGETFDNYIEEDSQDENLVGGSRSASNLQVANDSAERVANGVFDLYRLLSSDSNRLNQIVSNVKQVVGKDSYNVNHVFKHVKNGNYYLEIDTDKYNFAVNIVRLLPSEHSNHVSNTLFPSGKQTTHGSPSTRPETTSTPNVEPPKQTTPGKVVTGSERTPAPNVEPPKQTTPGKVVTGSERTPAPHVEPPKQTTPGKVVTGSERTPAPHVEPPKQTTPGKVVTGPERTPAPHVEPPKQTTPGKVVTGSERTPAPHVEAPKQTTPVSKPLQPEDEYLRKLEDKRFRQILGQWYRVGVPSKLYSDFYAWRACEIITIYSHNQNYFFKEMNNIGNRTYEMKDTPMISVDKKNSLFKINNDVHVYKMVMLEGKNYKIKLFELTNISNQTEGVQFYAERLIDKQLLSNVFREHYLKLDTVAIEQSCYSD